MGCRVYLLVSIDNVTGDEEIRPPASLAVLYFSINSIVPQRGVTHVRKNIYDEYHKKSENRNHSENKTLIIMNYL